MVTVTTAPIDVIRRIGVLPIARGVTQATLLRSTAVLAAEGIPVIEVTLDSPDALAAITALCRQYGGSVAVGAGTVRSVESAVRAADAGAQFLVTPSLRPEVIEAAARSGLPIIAGALTPAEIEQAFDQGSAMVKVFPASPMGADYIRLILSPLADIPLVPTGGITATNAAEFIAAGAAAVGVGSSLLGARAADESWLRGQTRVLLDAVKAGRSHNA